MDWKEGEPSTLVIHGQDRKSWLSLAGSAGRRANQHLEAAGRRANQHLEAAIRRALLPRAASASPAAEAAP